MYLKYIEENLKFKICTEERTSANKRIMRRVQMIKEKCLKNANYIIVHLMVI